MIIKRIFLTLTISILFLQTSCFIKEKCYSNDCSDNKICNKETGECVYECNTDKDCGINFRCENHRCIAVSNSELNCPPDMVNIENSFCMDRYEASRPDATESSEGVDNSYATSRKGVMPMYPVTLSLARSACLSYNYSHRDSIISRFDYDDHKIILGVNLNMKKRQKTPEVIYKYPFEKIYFPAKIDENSIQNTINILQENETIQRGSQCKD